MPAVFQFSDFVLDPRRFELRQGNRIRKLEKIPMELLILLVERSGELVTREDIVEELWGKDVFLEADRGINTAISKVRLALRDDAENPHYVQTVVGKGYRFIASISRPVPDGEVKAEPSNRTVFVRATTERVANSTHGALQQVLEKDSETASVSAITRPSAVVLEPCTPQPSISSHKVNSQATEKTVPKRERVLLATLVLL